MKKNWIDVFRKTANENPHKTAVVWGEKEITFDKLNNESLRVAAKILEMTRVVNRPIVVLLPKSIEVVYVDIGIMYSHNIFSNLDVKTPGDRLNNIISVMKPIGIITNDKYIDVLNKNDDIFIINLDDEDSIRVDEKNILIRLENQIDTDPFCIINTSGSTGTPKGVVLNHKSFFDFMDWSLSTFDFNIDTIIGALSPIVFDIYEYELCLMMTVGATMVLLDAAMAAFPARLLNEMSRTKVNFIFWVPTIMVNIANMNLLERISVSTLKIVWFAGEVFPTKQFKYWQSKLPQTVFANLYGPIEITLDCIYYIVDKEIKDEEPLPIGIPCKNTDILLLNEMDQLCVDDEEGEICVRGTSLAMGYYNNPEKTNQVFVQNPLNDSYIEYIYRTGDIAYKSSQNGLIYFKGRKDSLIKHSGYRIELGEIEHILVNDLKVVKNCCVVYHREKKEIAIIYEKKFDEASEIKKKLKQVIPKYMIPKIWKQMDELPRNTNGKIDRLALDQMINSEV